MFGCISMEKTLERYREYAREYHSNDNTTDEIDEQHLQVTTVLVLLPINFSALVYT